MRKLFAASLCLTLTTLSGAGATIASAQASQPSPETQVETSGPTPLRVTSSDRRAIARIWEELASSSAQPAALTNLDSGDGGLSFTLRSNGNTEVEAVEDAPLLAIQAHPPSLVKMFRDDIELAERRLRATMGMVYISIGIDFEDVAPVVRSLFDFPNQVTALEVRVERDKRGALRGSVALTPVQGTWFEQLTNALGPAASPIPQFDSRGSVMNLRASIDLHEVSPLISPLVAPFATSWARDEEEEARVAGWYERLYSAFAGTFHVSLFATEPQGASTMFGLADPEEYLALRRDPAFRAYEKRSSTAGGQAKTTFEPGATQHRDVVFERMRIELEVPEFGLSNPFVGADGVLETLTAVVDDVMVTTARGTPRAHNLVDQLKDTPVANGDLPAGRLLEFEMDVTQVLAMVTKTMNLEPPSPSRDGFPEKISVQLSHGPGEVRVDFQTK